jgi:hypothetical protein
LCAAAAGMWRAVLCWAVALEAGAMTWGSSFQTEKAGFLRLVLREGQQHAHALALRVPCALATLTSPHPRARLRPRSLLHAIAAPCR